ncbi:MAG: hypothetical protein H6581_14075 [Bacteroidia bacterium]|nr:hypothetical protein [Bacteroidia bacterium]
MARINGVNSDYKFINGIVDKSWKPPLPAPNLEMKLFICPYEEKNALEADNNICVGEDNACPHAVTQNGHAFVHLSQTEGIKLKTDGGTQIQLEQNSGGGTGKITLNPASGTTHFNGEIELVANGHTIKISPLGTGISLKHTNGAEVVFKANGGLDLITKNNTGTVNIQGNLVVSGTLTRQGQAI